MCEEEKRQFRKELEKTRPQKSPHSQCR